MFILQNIYIPSGQSGYYTHQVIMQSHFPEPQAFDSVFCKGPKYSGCGEHVVFVQN